MAMPDHRHGLPPGDETACLPVWHSTCRNCGRPVLRVFIPGGGPLWLHDNPGAAPYIECPTSRAEPEVVIDAGG